MTPVAGRAVTHIGGPDHQMCCANDDFVITSGTAVDLGRARGRYRADLVFV